MKYALFRNLDTPRLVLRKLSMEDVPFFFTRLGGSGAVTKYMLFQPHKDITESAASVRKVISRYESGRCYRWAIALKESGELIGIIEPLRFDEKTSCCSFAYMLGQDFWGKGYGTEALTAVLHFLFAEMEMERVEADHMADNAASGAVMRKAGMVYQGTKAGFYEKQGKVYDAPQYAITREQWMKK